MAKYRFDCIKFRGYKPCAARRLCESCPEYEPWDRKIAIVKLGALGDVMRTTPILHAFRRKFPRAHVTWVTKSNARDMLETSPRINRLVYVDQPDSGGVLRLMAEDFDEMHCYDKEDAAIGLAALIRAKKKFGFHMNALGQMAPLNPGSEYCFDLGLSDELKFFRNKRTYQEVTYECSELPAPKPMDPYDFTLKTSDREAALFLMKRLRWETRAGVARPPVIAFNTGTGRVFRTKQWPEEHFVELARLLKKKHRARILLLGGEDEDARNKRLASTLKGIAHYPGCGFSIRQFAGVLEQCDAVVTGDTLAMHLALAVGTPPVVMFGSTCEQEVDLYGLGRKLVSRPQCAPCYKNECDQTDWMRCMRDISPAMVQEAVMGALDRHGGPDRPPKRLA